MSALSQGFAMLPEGALLRITASLDLQSGMALTSASSAAHEGTAGALLALAEGISEAQEEHRTAAAAIQQERVSGQQQQTPEGAMLLEIMGMLAPLRNSRLAQQNHGTELVELFEALEQGTTTALTPEAELGLDAREAEADSARHAREEQLRIGVAAGFLQQLPHAAAAPDIEPPVVVAPFITSATAAAAVSQEGSPSTIDMPGLGSLSQYENLPIALSSGASSSWETSLSISPSLPEPSFANVPEGPLLRVASLMDLDSGKALNAADTTVRDSTEAALRSLGAAIAQARQEQRETTAAIEEERLAARQHQTAEGAAWAAALNLLAPHRGSFNRLGGMNDQVAQLFGMLEQGPEQQPEHAAEVEAAFDARIAGAAAVAEAREAAVRARVADGDLHAGVVM